MVHPHPRRQHDETTTHSAAAASNSAEQVDVVLFGVGDLRVDDHLGLQRALSRENQVVLPLCLLETKNQLTKIPGVVAHTADTAKLLSSALNDLNQNLLDTFQMPLTVEWVKDDSSWSNAILDIVRQQNPQMKRIRVHVCDLGPIDNDMGYGAYSQLLLGGDSKDDNIVEIVPWNNHLRDEPWTNVQEIPTSFPDYESKFTSASPPQTPVNVSSIASTATCLVETTSSMIPTAEQLTDKLTQQLELDPERVQAEANTGLYATHWGGLPAETVGSTQALKLLQCFTSECEESDTTWEQHPNYIGRLCRRNGRSFEHASMMWQLRGDGRSPAGNPLNWLAGESMVRYLAAPLLLGTISPRRIWHAATEQWFFTSSSTLR